MELNDISDPLLRTALSAKNEEMVESNIAAMQSNGLNRFSLANPAFFSEHKTHCKTLYGFPSFDFLTSFIEEMFGVSYIVPKSATVSRGGNDEDKGLSQFEQILLTLFFCNSLWNYKIIGSLFGVKSRITVGKIIDKWLPVIGEIGDMLSSFYDLIDEQSLKKLEPEWYIRMNLRKIAAIVDGKDFLTETIRSDRVLNSLQSSNKVNHSAFRVLTWSLPCGAVVERTPAFFGRASEKSIMRAWGSKGRLLFPPDHCILGDKGFDNTAGCYTNYNTTLHPSFLTSTQFSREEVNHNIQICKKRYSCETVYSHVTETVKLSGIYKKEWFHHFDSILGWAHGRANICYGYLQKINNYEH